MKFVMAKGDCGLSLEKCSYILGVIHGVYAVVSFLGAIKLLLTDRSGSPTVTTAGLIIGMIIFVIKLFVAFRLVIHVTDQPIVIQWVLFETVFTILIFIGSAVNFVGSLTAGALLSSIGHLLTGMITGIFGIYSVRVVYSHYRQLEQTTTEQAIPPKF